MIAIILAAGEGKRLRPLTNTVPKCMVKLFGKSILDWQLEILRDAGLSKIIVVGGYRAEEIGTNEIQLVINEQFLSTNMVFSLFCASHLLSSDTDILIVYGDIIFEKRIIMSLIESKAQICVSVDRQWRPLWESRMSDPLDDAETLKMRDGNRIVEIGQKPNFYSDIEGQFRGLLKIRFEGVARLQQSWRELQAMQVYAGESVTKIYMTSFIQYMVDSGVDVRADLIDGGWLEIDTVQDVSVFDFMYRKGFLTQFINLI